MIAALSFVTGMGAGSFVGLAYMVYHDVGKP